MMDRKEDDLLKNQTLERKALPKRIRQEMKAREQMFRASMRISVTNLNEVMNPTEEKDRLKKVGGEARKHLMTNRTHPLNGGFQIGHQKLSSSSVHQCRL